MRTADQTRFLTEIEPVHGPIESFRRFFHYADALNRKQGVVISFATLDELLEVNERNRDTWKPLFPVFNTRMNTIAADSAFCLLGRNPDGDVVSAQAARLFDWEGTNLKREAESLRWFYDDPGQSKRPGEACVVTAPSAEDVRGRVAFLGAVWYRADYRKRMPTLVDFRVGPIYALSRWHPDYFALVMGEALATKGLAPRFGREPEWDIRFTNNVLFGDERVALLQSTYDESLARLTGFLSSLDSEIDVSEPGNR